MVSSRYVLSDYFDAAMASSVFEALEDGKCCGRIPECTGLLAFGETEQETRKDLRSALEEWVLLGLKFGHSLPTFGGIDLNGEPALEPVDSL